MARVVIEHLTKVFRGPAGEEIHALTDASLAIEEGELLVLLGPSGCGKTTALRLIAGLEQPTAGSISIGGEIVNGLPPKARDVAMVFQAPALYPHLTVYENMAFGLQLRRCPRAEIEHRVKEAAELLGLKDCLSRLPMALSGGQRQRVAVGRALVRRPRVFLFDEPLSNLDAPTRARLREELARLHARLGVTMVYVTHDQVEALMLGQRVAVMRAGAIQQVGPPLVLYQQPVNLFVAEFIGSPPINCFQGTLVARGQKLYFQAAADPGADRSSPLTLHVEEAMAAGLKPCVGGRIIFGIRPEHLGDRLDAPGMAAGQGTVATVELIEAMGGETCVHLAAGGCSFTTRRPATDCLNVGEKLFVRFDMRQAHFFEPATGKAIV